MNSRALAIAAMFILLASDSLWQYNLIGRQSEIIAFLEKEAYPKKPTQDISTQNTTTVNPEKSRSSNDIIVFENADSIKKEAHASNPGNVGYLESFNPKPRVLQPDIRVLIEQNVRKKTIEDLDDLLFSINLSDDKRLSIIEEVYKYRMGLSDPLLMEDAYSDEVKLVFSLVPKKQWDQLRASIKQKNLDFLRESNLIKFREKIPSIDDALLFKIVEKIVYEVDNLVGTDIETQFDPIKINLGGDNGKDIMQLIRDDIADSLTREQISQFDELIAQISPNTEAHKQ